MSKIKIIESDLIDLLDDNSQFRTGYLDRQTGEILILFEDDGDISCVPGQEEIAEMIEEDPDRYLRIEPLESFEAFRIMEDFVASLPEGENRNLLGKVLSWKKPFFNFKQALGDMGDLSDQWFRFQKEELRRFALKWLEYEEIDAELVPYTPPDDLEY